MYDSSQMDEMGGSRELGESASGRRELTGVLLLSQSGESTERLQKLLSLDSLSQEHPRHQHRHNHQRNGPALLRFASPHSEPAAW